MDTRFTLVAILLYIFTAEVQLVSNQLGNFSLPVTYPAKVLEGGEQICPIQGQLEMARMQIKEEIQVLISAFGQEQQVKVADFNMSRPDEQCPDGLTLITSPTRLCRISGARCHSVTHSTINMQYKTVCGTVIGYGFGTTDAFADLCRNECDTIDGPYVDGVSITHGSPRQHIWSFAMDAPHVTRCPCNSRSSYGPPSYVGDDYNCETYVPSEPVWDGQNCMPAGEQCCQRPPMFCKELSEPTTDDIEVRVCTDESLGNEGVAVQAVEIYIQ